MPFAKLPFANHKSLIVLALTYWLYFGQLGVLVPYLGIFLDGRGFSSAEIGELFAVITLARILGPGIWAGIADKKGNAVSVLRLGSFLPWQLSVPYSCSKDFGGLPFLSA